MRLNNLFSATIFLSLILNADSIKHNSINKHGIVGLINMPTARTYDEGSFAFNLSRKDPDRNISLSLHPYDWLEFSIAYSSIKDREYPGYDQDYKDKSFSSKIILNKQNRFPSLAIGFNDIGGTGIYSSEYIVSSYGSGVMDLHLGIGWGRLMHGPFQLKNPLIDIDNSFKQREENFGKGGEIFFEDLFSGEKAAFFGGFSYLLDKNILLKAELDSSQIPESMGFPVYDSDYNFALDFFGKNHSFTLSYERGSFIGASFTYKQDNSRYKSNPYKKVSISGEKSRDLIKALNTNNIGLINYEITDKRAYLDVQEYSYFSKEILDRNILKSLSNANIYVEEIITSYSTAGLQSHKSNPDALMLFSERNNLQNNKFLGRLNSSYGINVRPFIASREDFLKLALLFELDYEYVITNSFFYSGNIKYPIWHNYDDLYIPPLDPYKNQVRSDIKDYLNNFGSRLILGRSQFDFFRSFGNGNIQLTAGILEEMYSGFGFEYLYMLNKYPIGIGIESFKVFKRDYDLRFNIADYENITTHINLFYENKFVLPFTMHLSYGEYLAGDKGYTFDISRKFNNGIEMGAFFTRTDVPKEIFGEGSFDKGIYFRLPLSNELFSFTWRPLTKDPGSKLVRKNTLYQLLGKYNR